MALPLALAAEISTTHFAPFSLYIISFSYFNYLRILCAGWLYKFIFICKFKCSRRRARRRILDFVATCRKHQRSTMATITKTAYRTCWFSVGCHRSPRPTPRNHLDASIDCSGVDGKVFGMIFSQQSLNISPAKHPVPTKRCQYKKFWYSSAITKHFVCLI